MEPMSGNQQNRQKNMYKKEFKFILHSKFHS